jgi:hypothetical protein
MNRSVKVKFYADPGHGWLAVKRDLLYKFNIADKISVYSYQRGETVYLEEDCDYTTFENAASQHGFQLIVDQKYTNNRSPIRSYSNYKAPILINS